MSTVAGVAGIDWPWQAQTPFQIVDGSLQAAAEQRAWDVLEDRADRGGDAEEIQPAHGLEAVFNFLKIGHDHDHRVGPHPRAIDLLTGASRLVLPGRSIVADVPVEVADRVMIFAQKYGFLGSAPIWNQLAGSHGTSPLAPVDTVGLGTSVEGEHGGAAAKEPLGWWLEHVRVLRLLLQLVALRREDRLPARAELADRMFPLHTDGTTPYRIGWWLDGGTLGLVPHPRVATPEGPAEDELNQLADGWIETQIMRNLRGALTVSFGRLQGSVPDPDFASLPRLDVRDDAAETRAARYELDRAMRTSPPARRELWRDSIQRAVEDGAISQRTADQIIHEGPAKAGLTARRRVRYSSLLAAMYDAVASVIAGETEALRRCPDCETVFIRWHGRHKFCPPTLWDRRRASRCGERYRKRQGPRRIQKEHGDGSE